MKRDNLRRSADELRVHCQSQRKYITLKFSEFEHASDAVHEDGVTRGLITKHLGGTIAIFVLAHDLTPLSSMPAMAILIEASAARGAVSRGRKFGEHHCRALASAFVVAHFADCFARRLHRQLADLALGLPRCLTFLPRECLAPLAIALRRFAEGPNIFFSPRNSHVFRLSQGEGINGSRRPMAARFAMTLAPC